MRHPVLRWAARAVGNEAFLAATAMLLFTAATYRALAVRERVELSRATGLAAQTLENGVEAEVSLRVRSLEKLGYHRLNRPGFSQQDWEDEAALFTSAYSGNEPVAWLDPSLAVQLQAPPSTTAPWMSGNDPADSAIAMLFRNAARERRIRAVHVSRGTKEHRWLLVAVPLLRGTAVEGFAAASFDCDRLLEAVADRTVRYGYHVAISDGNAAIYSRPAGARPSSADDYTLRTVDLYGSRWRVAVWPAPASLAELSSRLPTLTLATGLIFTLLVVTTIRFAARARDRSVLLAEANSRLESGIEDRIRAGEELRLANQTLAAVIDRSPVAIVQISADGTIGTWNPAAAELLGWGKSPAGGALREAGGKELDGLRTRARAGQEVQGAECEVVRPDGTILEGEVWIAPQYESGGKTAGFIVMIADAGDRRRFQQQLREAQRMDAVSRLAGGIAHNFNNLLAIITGYSHLALEGLPPDHTLRGELEEVLKAADRAARLTVQLLAFGRGQAIRPEIVDLNRVVEQLRDVLGRVAAPCQLIMPLGAGLGTVRVDPEQVEQILIALVINARDAMPEGGRISVETSSAEVRDTGATAHPRDVLPGLYVVLSVIDRGMGIDEQAQRHVFEPFYTTKEREPAGLGLSSVYGIAKQNGGAVAVMSRPGEGTRVEVYLPRA